MIFSYISVHASSNNPTTAKLLGLSVLTVEDGNILGEFTSYVKPVPRISKVAIAHAGINYADIKTTNPFCDLVPTLIAQIENTQTVFSDAFSERLFKKSFKEVGYPIGNATYILEKLWKKNLSSSIPYSLENAHALLQLEDPIPQPLEACGLMEKIASRLQEGNVMMGIPVVATSGSIFPKHYQALPKTPGVYFFRDHEGEVIYVGKAINIHKRIRSHYTSSELFERELCAATHTVDFEETGSELVALLLEAHYIAYLKPRFNTRQIDLIDPYTISSKMDAKGILRIQAIQKSYSDSENEFYYNRQSVLEKITEIQKKFRLCARFSGIIRSSGSCGDTSYCQGICQGQEEVGGYNEKVKAALNYVFNQRQSYIIKLKGRNRFEAGMVLVKNGIYHGFGFVDADAQINSLEDMESFIKPFPHTYFSSRILDQFHKTNKRKSETVFPLICADAFPADL